MTDRERKTALELELMLMEKIRNAMNWTRYRGLQFDVSSGGTH